MIRDAFAFVFFLFVIAISILLAYGTFDLIDDAINDSTTFNATHKATMNDQKTRFGNVWDYTFLTLFIAALVGVLILSWVLRTNPAIFFVIVIIIGIFGLLAGYLANAWDSFTGSGLLGNAVAEFRITDHIMNNYMIYVIATVFLMLIVFFAKPNEGVL